MKLFSFFLLLFLLPFITSAQNLKTKTLLIISPYTSTSSCKRVALKVSDSKIEIDDCYDVKSKKFNCKKSISLTNEKLIVKIYNMTGAKLKQHEKDINATNCDYGFPINFVITENGKTSTIEWRDVKKCYPKSAKKIAKPLLKLLNKYRKRSSYIKK
jgi:hypothetical protein